MSLFEAFISELNLARQVSQEAYSATRSAIRTATEAHEEMRTIGNKSNDPNAAAFIDASQAALRHLISTLDSIVQSLVEIESYKVEIGGSQTGSYLLELSTLDPAHANTLNFPPPNFSMIVDGRFKYSTDEHGRVTNADAILDTVDPAHPRNRTEEAKLSGKLPGDHAGHIFARIFKGPWAAINLTPMHGASVNQSEYRVLENRWRNLITKSGKAVNLSISLVYPSGNTRRPDFILVRQEVDGKVKQQRIANTSESDV